MLQLYGNVIADQKRNGFLEKVKDVANTQTRVHYIPYHPVRKQSSTTPIRIVYDCSCRQSLDHASDLILELILDLSADTFIQAFRRFFSRKSAPDIIISDNVTTFNTSKHICKWDRKYITSSTSGELTGSLSQRELRGAASGGSVL
jgi:hypothetical protein